MPISINIIFPHQLFADSELLKNGNKTYLIEEYLFYKQYNFHKQKIAYHRATMKYYQDYLEQKGIDVVYIASDNPLSDIRNFGNEIKASTISEIHVIDPVDNWLNKRLHALSDLCIIKTYDSQLFINTEKDLSTFFKPSKKKFFQTTFYKQERKRLNILLDQHDEPIGGQWSYDKENRKKYPKNKIAPPIDYPASNKYWSEAVTYTTLHFGDNIGQLSESMTYPITHQEADDWFQQFLEYRFYDFGAYEDAIVAHQGILHHSVLTPMLNIGLILPRYIVNKSIDYAAHKNIPINSTEGFVRQIIGWREFIRGMYIAKGTYSRNQNFWNFTRKIPKSFYDGTTGIDPVDHTIKKVLKTGYCHHIERLMILGNIMLLCEFDPDEVYRWFMELFIDAYDWVMVPNVYGMSQFADGGTFATKPYIGGSNYIKKMSNYPSGDWQPIWDGLFWNFISKHQNFFLSNPRMAMMAHTYNRMDADKVKAHLENAQSYLDSL